MRVYCNHHNQFGSCSEQDYKDSKEGRNPSRMVRVHFKTFTQAVPLNTLVVAPCWLTIGLEVHQEKLSNRSYYGKYDDMESVEALIDTAMTAAHG